VTYGRAFVAGTLALVGALLPAAVGAQISIDGSLRPGTAGPLTGPNFVIGSGVGRTVGNNLFHSFGQFNVGAGESATFTGLPSIGNVISRVTGGQLSSINGLIDTRTFMPTANFFLLNPAGIMLGAGASLNVGGAFHLSTADYLCLGSGGCLADPTAGKFFASLGRGDVLTVAAPAAFGFFGPPPTGSIGIVVDGSNLPGIPDPPVGQTMSLVGGQIQVTNATLSPPGGHVQLVSVNSMGEVPIPSLDLRGFSALGSITVTSSTIDVSGDPAGSVVIRGGNLLIDATNITAVTGAVAAPVGIELSAAGSLWITNGSTLLSLASGDGRGGDIRLSGSSLELTNGSTLFSLASGGGRGGDIRLSGTSVELTNGSTLFSSTSGDGRGGDILLSGGSLKLTNGAVALSSREGAGAGGDVSLTGDTVTIAGGSAVLSLNQAEGPARNGNISVTATGAMLITESGTIQSIANAGDGGQVSVTAGSLIVESSASISSSTATGFGGEVVVTAPQLTIRSGGQISSSVFETGRGGDVRVISTGSATIEDPGTSISTAGFFFNAEAPGLGAPGDVLTSFGSLTLTRGATIQSGVDGGTQAGNVSLVATGPIVISDGAGIGIVAFFKDAGNITISAPQVFVRDGFINTGTRQSGRAGDISITAGTLALESGGQIVSASIAEGGPGGDVHLNIGGSLTISGRSPTGGSVLPPFFSVFFTDPRSGIYSTTAGSAPGGNVTIQSAQIQLLDSGTISASSTGVLLASGPAGRIDANASESITITGSSPTGESVLPLQTGIFSTTAGTGPGGNITLRAPQIRLADGGTISASSTGGPSATAGSIDITFGSLFQMDHASISTDSTLADGGNITITSTGSLLHMIDSQITTSVRSGVGGGGNITLGSTGHPLDFIVLDNSGIHADAFGGPGGNINIFANVMFSSTPIETAVTASSALSAPGTVNINAAITDVSGSLAELSTEVLGAAALLRASCAARLAEGKTSSLVVAGREGLPLEPGGLLPSALRELHAAGVAGSAAPFFASEWPGLRLSYLDAACGR
jgi:filamentous hemagglutinin family protein